MKYRPTVADYSQLLETAYPALVAELPHTKSGKLTSLAKGWLIGTEGLPVTASIRDLLIYLIVDPATVDLAAQWIRRSREIISTGTHKLPAELNDAALAAHQSLIVEIEEEEYFDPELHLPSEEEEEGGEGTLVMPVTPTDDGGSGDVEEDGDLTGELDPCGEPWRRSDYHGYSRAELEQKWQEWEKQYGTHSTNPERSKPMGFATRTKNWKSRKAS
jgi:hypothetical protein